MTTHQNGLSQNALRLQKRLRAENRFRRFGLAAVGLAVAILISLLSTIGYLGIPAMFQAQLTLSVKIDPKLIDSDEIYAASNDIQDLMRGDWMAPVYQSMDALFPEMTSPRDRRAMHQLISQGAGKMLQDYVRANPGSIGGTVTMNFPASSETDMVLKGKIARTSAESERKISNRQIVWIDDMVAKDVLQLRFNAHFFTAADSREPELAGIYGGLIGSLFTMLITVLFALPIGVCAAIYLEEFAPRNRLISWIEININNLAAVPSIIYGLLGLGLFLGLLGLPRSSPLAGGLVLGLMTMPVIIIATRSALAAVPPSIRDGALALGASPIQAVFHHILPLAMPGIMTGTIIGMARALGETAPLLMIGMVAFVAVAPDGITSPSSVLPVQIFLWADSPERGFIEKTAAAIAVLLAFLLSTNGLALYLRHKFEKKW